MNKDIKFYKAEATNIDAVSEGNESAHDIGGFDTIQEATSFSKIWVDQVLLHDGILADDSSNEEYVCNIYACESAKDFRPGHGKLIISIKIGTGTSA